MIITDLSKMLVGSYPARRWTRNLVGGPASVQATQFSMELVILEPNEGQVPCTKKPDA
jgi:hypothetical protein